MLICFVINPVAGATDKSNLPLLLAETALVYGFEYVTFFTSGLSDFENLCAFTALHKPSIIAALGGDGTINLCARVAVNSPLIVGIVPLGSANGLAGELRLNTDMVRAIETLVTAKPRAVDTLLINGNLCLHLADAGMNALIIQRYGLAGGHGFLSYAKHLIKELFYLRRHRYILKFNATAPASGEPGQPGTTAKMSKKALMIAFANTRKYGNGAIVNPVGVMNDGLFEVCIFKSITHRRLPAVIWHFFRGTLNLSDYVETIQTTDLVFR